MYRFRALASATFVATIIGVVTSAATPPSFPSDDEIHYVDQVGDSASPCTFQGRMCRGGKIKSIASADSIENCRKRCETRFWGCHGFEYHAITRSCALYRARPFSGDRNAHATCEIPASSCRENGAAAAPVPPTKSPSKNPSFLHQPVEMATNDPTQSPTITGSTRSSNDEEEDTDTDVNGRIPAKTNEEVVEAKNECIGGAKIAGSGCFEVGEECTVGEETCCGRTFDSVTCTCSVIEGVEMHGFGVWSCVHSYPCSFLKHTC